MIFVFDYNLDLLSFKIYLMWGCYYWDCFLDLSFQYIKNWTLSNIYYMYVVVFQEIVKKKKSYLIINYIWSDFISWLKIYIKFIFSFLLKKIQPLRGRQLCRTPSCHTQAVNHPHAPNFHLTMSSASNSTWLALPHESFSRDFSLSLILLASFQPSKQISLWISYKYEIILY